MTNQSTVNKQFVYENVLYIKYVPAAPIANARGIPIQIRVLFQFLEGLGGHPSSMAASLAAMLCERTVGSVVSSAGLCERCLISSARLSERSVLVDSVVSSARFGESIIDLVVTAEKLFEIRVLIESVVSSGRLCDTSGLVDSVSS